MDAAPVKGSVDHGRGKAQSCRTSRRSHNSARANPVCVKGLFGSVFARVAGRPRGARGSSGRSVGVGFGSDFSEVPVFRDLPAALDFRVAPDCPPGPRSRSAAGVGAESLVDGVADRVVSGSASLLCGTSLRLVCAR